MDGWDDRYLAQCRFCFKKNFEERWKGDGPEYSWGTTVENKDGPEEFSNWVTPS
jgi:hypothetical protein